VSVGLLKLWFECGGCIISVNVKRYREWQTYVKQVYKVEAERIGISSILSFLSLFNCCWLGLCAFIRCTECIRNDINNFRTV